MAILFLLVMVEERERNDKKERQSALFICPSMVRSMWFRDGGCVSASALANGAHLPVAAPQVYRRRFSVMQACTRAVRDHTLYGAGAGLIRAEIEQEEPQMIEGFYVSIVLIRATFVLPAEEGET